jgi:hypothetical protein
VSDTARGLDRRPAARERPAGGSGERPAAARTSGRTIALMERRGLADRQFDALLARLDRIAEQLERIDGRLEAHEGLLHISRELRALNESLNALAYAALGQRPQVRRRSAG